MIQDINIRQIEEDVMHNKYEKVIKYLLHMIPSDKEYVSFRQSVIIIGSRIIDLLNSKEKGMIKYEEYLRQVSQEGFHLLQIVDRLKN